jgi:hypothetical protein
MHAAHACLMLRRMRVGAWKQHPMMPTKGALSLAVAIKKHQRRQNPRQQWQLVDSGLAS